MFLFIWVIYRGDMQGEHIFSRLILTFFILAVLVSGMFLTQWHVENRSEYEQQLARTLGTSLRQLRWEILSDLIVAAKIGYDATLEIDPSLKPNPALLSNALIQRILLQRGGDAFEISRSGMRSLDRIPQPPPPSLSRVDEQWFFSLESKEDSGLYLELDSLLFQSSYINELLPRYTDSQMKDFVLVLSDESNDELIWSSEDMDYSEYRKKASNGFDIFIALNAAETVFPAKSPPSAVNHEALRKLNIDQLSGMHLAAWHRQGTIQEASGIRLIIRLAGSFAILGIFSAAIFWMFSLYQKSQILRVREYEFSANVSHELKTPVTGIQALAENLSAGLVKESGKIQHYGETIQAMTKRLSELIEHILFYSRISMQSPEKYRQEVDLEALLSSVLANSEKPIILQKNFKDPSFICDPYAVELILGNLLNNAIKHNAEQVSITLSLAIVEERKGRVLAIRVADTGSGIEKKEIRNISKAFSRGRRTVENQIPGSGLGLHLVWRITKLYGGSMKIESRQGTVVNIRIPEGTVHGS
jgi:signal transduction histidine kinase